MNSKQIISIIIVLVLLAGAGFYFLRSSETPEPATPTSPVVVNDEDTPPVFPSEPQIPDNYVKFENANFGYEFFYPESSDAQVNNDIVSVGEYGPTQTEGTEVFDGYFVNITEFELGELAFDEFVTTRFEENSVNSEVVEAVTPFSHNRYEGYAYTMSGLGTFSYVYLTNGSNVLEISYLVEDPGNLGYQTYVDNIIDSIMFK